MALQVRPGQGGRRRSITIAGALAAAALFVGVLVGPGGARAVLRPTRHDAARPSVAAVIRAIQEKLPHLGSPNQPAPALRHGETRGLSSASSYNWSGYVDTTGGSVTSYKSVWANWRQPKVTCDPGLDQAAVWWVGLDGWSTGTVEQAGTLAWCQAGTASYFDWWEMYPTVAVEQVNPISVGDNISALAEALANGNYLLKVTDWTHTAASFQVTEHCASTCSNASAEWIAETPGEARGYAPWPNFGTWQMKAATVVAGSTKGTISTFPDLAVTIIGSRDEALAATSALTTSSPNGFSVTWGYGW